MKLPWMCPACATVHTHPSAGCRHCGREIPDEEPDPISRIGESEVTERSDRRGTTKQRPSQSHPAG
jgi:hypothetical protein